MKLLSAYSYMRIKCVHSKKINILLRTESSYVIYRVIVLENEEDEILTLVDCPDLVTTQGVCKHSQHLYCRCMGKAIRIKRPTSKLFLVRGTMLEDEARKREREIKGYQNYSMIRGSSPEGIFTDPLRPEIYDRN